MVLKDPEELVALGCARDGVEFVVRNLTVYVFVRVDVHHVRDRVGDFVHDVFADVLDVKVLWEERVDLSVPRHVHRGANVRAGTHYRVFFVDATISCPTCSTWYSRPYEIKIS